MAAREILSLNILRIICIYQPFDKRLFFKRANEFYFVYTER